jgi:hypothetical protein
MNIIQVSYFFKYEKLAGDQITLIIFSLIFAFIDCWLGLVAWFDYNLINNEFKLN